MAKLSIRIQLEPAGAIGPGKIRLLELIDQTGSISAAGRTMKMSYRRAWILIDELNRLFLQAVVATNIGGKAGGGAELTSFGRELVQRYRAIESGADAVAQKHLIALEQVAAKPEPEAG